MKLLIEDIEIPVADFQPKKGGVYALLCKGMGVFGAIEAAYRLARETGFEDGAVAAEHFFFQREFQFDSLRKELEILSVSGWSNSGVMVVIPGMSKRHFQHEYRTDEAEIAAYLFLLRKQLDSLNYPIFVPFHTEDFAVNEKVLWSGLAAMGFTRIAVEMDGADKAAGSILHEDALDEAASMAVFPDASDLLAGEDGGVPCV